MIRSVFTRFLHALLAAAIVHQLVTSLLLEEPRSRRIVENAPFELHETIGLASLGLVTLFWLWTIVRRREHSLGDLFPWLSSVRVRSVMGDLRVHARELVRFRLPSPSEKTPLASAVHGLGLLVATLMAASGTAVYVFMPADGALTTNMKIALTVHGAAGNLMWAYLIAHAAIGLAHEMAGHKVVRRMFAGMN